MSIKEKILDDLKTAMKQKDSERLKVLRSIKAKILEKEISLREGGEVTLNDEQMLDVLTKAAKQRKESIEQFNQGGREELAAAEKKELNVIESYLPEMLSEEEVRAIVKKKIEELGAGGMNDMGRVMGALMGELKGKADGSVVSKVVKEELNG
jgi:uncharacterized protein